jgi:HEAT repeat protein
MKKILNLLLILFLATQIGHALEALDEEANKMYQQAYKLVTDKKWDKAIEIFKDLLDKYPDSSWEDDATFWICYASEKNGRKMEKSFECYEDFIDDFSDSKWADDALQNLGQLAQDLKNDGKPEYLERVKNLENEVNNELSLAAIRALSSRGDRQSFDSIVRIFDSNKNQSLRKKMVYIIGSFESKESATKLMDIVENDPDKDVRSEAIFWLSDNDPTEEIAEFLQNTALNDKEYKVQKKALFSLSNMDNEFGIPYLYKIAQDHSNDDIRADAIFWIGQSSQNPKTLKNLSQFARDDKSFAVQKKAIFALAEMELDAALDELVLLSKELKNAELRSNALFWLSQNTSSEKHISAIRDAAFNDPEERVQEKAVFALHELDNNKGLDDLIDIAKNHPSVRVRKKAIFWLGENGDDRAVQALEDILMSPKK